MKKGTSAIGKATRILCLSLIAAIFAAVGFGCGGGGDSDPVEAKFKTGAKTEIAIGSEVDLFDYVEVVKGTTYTVTVTYKNLDDNTQTEEFTEWIMAFYPKFSGEHTLTYEVKRGSETDTATMTFTVLPAPPAISLNEKPVVRTLPSGQNTMVLDLATLMAEAQLSVSPVEAQVNVTKVEFRTVTAGFGEIYGDWTQKEDFTSGSASYDFKTAGQYRLTAAAQSGESTATDEFFVTVLADSSTGNDTFATAKNAIFSADDPNLVMLPAAAPTELSYVVIDKEFENGQSLNVYFKGKNIPQLGLYVTPKTDAADPYGINQAGGNLLSFVRTGHKWILGTSIDNGTATHEHTLAMNTGLVAKSGSTEGIGFDPDSLQEDRYYMLSYSLASADDTVLAAQGYTKVVTFGFHVYEVECFGEADQALGEDLVDGSKIGNFRLKTDFPRANTKAVIYGSTQEMITVQYAPQDESISLYKTLVTGNSVTMESGNINIIEGRIQTDYAYLGLGKFGLGDTLVFEFTGKNIPNLALFCDTNDGQAAGGGQGLFIQTSARSAAYNSRFTTFGPWRLDPGNTLTDEQFNEYSTAFGLNKPYGTGDFVGNFSLDCRAATGTAMGKLEDDAEYRYTVTTNKASAKDKVTLIYKLEKKNGETWEDVTGSAATLALAHHLDQLVGDGFTYENRYAIVYGAYGRAISFTYSIIKAE